MSGRVLCFIWTLCILSSATKILDEGVVLNQDEAKAIPIQCPECDVRRCITDLKCKEGEVLREKESVCGCCPGCVILLGLNEPCSPTFGPRCEDALVCDPALLQCVINTTVSKCPSYQESVDNWKPPCEPGDTQCPYKDLKILWKPTCSPDGTFAARQCKGQKLTGRCFCYSPDGKKLFGAEWSDEAENMTCACSRRVWQLENADTEEDRRTDVTLHCNHLGNFEPLQCDNGLCWCADEKTGDPITTVLPENLMTVLPCYNGTVIGSQYLRQCESTVIAAARIGILMTQHGTQFRKSIRQRCDADGSFGHLQVTDDNRVICTWKDGSQLDQYAGGVSVLQSINCNCARDNRYYREDGKEFHKICNGNGNYESGQIEPGGKYYCVDSDGYAITDPVFVPPGHYIEQDLCIKLPTVP